MIVRPPLQSRANSGLTFQPDANTVLWLPGQDDPQSSTIRDRSGNGSNGAITGATWKNDTPSGSWYLSLDGSDDQVNCGNDSSLDITDNITFEFWWYHQSVAVDMLMSKGARDESFTGPWTIRATTTALNLYINDGLGLSSTITVADGNWYHIRFTYDKSNIRDYVNDVAGTPVAYAVAIPVDANDVIIGTGYGAGRNVKGGIALLRISNGISPSHFQQERHLFGV